MNQINHVLQQPAAQPPVAPPESLNQIPTPAGITKGPLLDSLSKTARSRSSASTEPYFKQIAEAIPQLVWTTDGNGKLEYCNLRYQTFSGKTIEELRDNWREEVHPDDVDNYLAQWRQCLASGLDFSAESRLLSADGSYRWFLIRACPIRAESMHILKWLGTCTDIHDEKMGQDQHAQLLEVLVAQRTDELRRVNLELQTARDQALKALEARALFVATVSHEIRTPMSGVLGMAELLLTCHLEQEPREIAKDLYDSAGALLSVVNHILDYSKLESGKLKLHPVQFSVRQLVSQVVAAIKPAAGSKSLEIHTHISPSIPEKLKGDDGRLRQVLLNLANNAVRFTKSGIIRLVVEPVSKQTGMIVLKFTMQDTGIGISPEALRNLFQPFNQADTSTSRHYGGTGLGLSIAKALVELMNGGITVQSVEGKGSIFAFTAQFEL